MPCRFGHAPSDALAGAGQVFHLGGFRHGRMVGIATITPRPMPGHAERAAWQVRGMAVTIVTSAKTDEEGRRLLQLLGMPFRAA